METIHGIRYLAPESLGEAVRALALWSDRAAPLAGGLDLVVRMKERSALPEVVVDLGSLPELRGVRREEGGISIGALTPISALAREELPEVPWLAGVAGEIGGRAHRTAATVGGNVLSALRCFAWNQSDPWREANGRCLREGGAVCHAAEGGACVATHQTDLPPLLAVLDATAEVVGPNGTRTSAVRDLALRRAEILTRILVPCPAQEIRAAYRKLTLRRGVDRPILGVAAAGRPEGGAVADLRLAVTGVGPEVGFLRMPAATPASAAARAAEAFTPSPAVREDPWWRRQVLPVIARRAVQALATAAAPSWSARRREGAIT